MTSKRNFNKIMSRFKFYIWKKGNVEELSILKLSELLENWIKTHKYSDVRSSEGKYISVVSFIYKNT